MAHEGVYTVNHCVNIVLALFKWGYLITTTFKNDALNSLLRFRRFMLVPCILAKVITAVNSSIIYSKQNLCQLFNGTCRLL